MSADVERPSRSWWKWGLAFLVIPVALVAAVLLLFFARRTIEETLVDPRAVVRITDSALVLDDGSRVRVAGIRHLEAGNDIIQRMVADGVEVQRDGRVIGLVKVHHWCGNDPVGRHIARVDLGLALRYFGYAESDPELDRWLPIRRDRPFSEHGWDVSDYSSFLGFASTAKALGRGGLTSQ